MIYLGLDFGQKRIGVACSDELGRFADPAGTIAYRSSHEMWQKLKSFLDETRAGVIVVGLPTRTTGEEGVEAKRVLKFAEELGKKTASEVTTWDERFTTQEAERILREVNLSPAKRREKKDALAAKIMLQSYLDHIRMRDS